MTNTKSYINLVIVIAFIFSNFHKSFAKNLSNKTLLLNCSQVFYDTGGLNGNYSDNESYTITYCPENIGEIVIANFNFFELENNYDFLRIYDGTDNTYPLIGEFTGNNSPGIVLSTLNNGGCLTFEFSSDFSINFGGWQAYINCEVPSSCLAPTEITLETISQTSAGLTFSEINNSQATAWEIEYGLTGFAQGSGTIIPINSNHPTITGLESNTTYDAFIRTICSSNETSYWSLPFTFTTINTITCGEMFYDSGSSDGNYENNENRTVTICPEDGADTITIVFNSFNLEENYDFMYIYDGNNTDNLIGEYTGSNSPAIITSTIENGGCLTIVFISDYSITSTGWSAQIYCGDPPSCLMPSEVIVDDVSDNSVFLFIEEINNPLATTWEVEYGITGFTQGSGTTITALSDYTEVIGLTSGTTYDAYVRSICDTDNMSIWTSKVTFTTTGVLSNDTYNVNVFSISPNPVEDTLTIKLKDFETGIIKIFNLEGRLILTRKSNANITKLNISDLTKGIYVIKIEAKNQSFIKKFIKL